MCFRSHRTVVSQAIGLIQVNFSWHFGVCWSKQFLSPSSPCRQPLVTFPSLSWVVSWRTLEQPDSDGRARCSVYSLYKSTLTAISASNRCTSACAASSAIELKLSVILDFVIVTTSTTEGTFALSSASYFWGIAPVEATSSRRSFCESSLVAIGSTWNVAWNSNTLEPEARRFSVRHRRSRSAYPVRLGP